MNKSLDEKLADIHANPHSSRVYMLADAKDADMAFGIASPGYDPGSPSDKPRLRPLAEYRDQIRQIVQQGMVDVMLMSASTNDLLTISERLFDYSRVTPAVRANDTSDIWLPRGGEYHREPSRPFRTATIDHAQCGAVDCPTPESRTAGANLGLYSVTFNNRVADDHRSLEAYHEFRIEAERKGFRHFLEVFAPNAPHNLLPEAVPGFVNDCIVRLLAGVSYSSRPLFLKIPYQGPAALQELVNYDPHLVVGILGGGAGTTYDAFKLIAESKKYGARIALFGRKINAAENQLVFVEFLRLVAEGLVSPEEAVPAYHSALQTIGLKPTRSLADDMVLQTNVMSYQRSNSVALGSLLFPSDSAIDDLPETSPAQSPSGIRIGTKEAAAARRAALPQIPSLITPVEIDDAMTPPPGQGDADHSSVDALDRMALDDDPTLIGKPGKYAPPTAGRPPKPGKK